MQNMVYVNCCVCGEDNTAPFMVRDLLHLVTCRDCGMVYRNPQRTQSELKKIYDETYFKSNNSGQLGYNNYLNDKNNIEKTFAKRLDFIEKMIKSSALLDIGCAYGFFMEVANQRGWHSIGIDISYPALNYAKNSLGLNVICADIETVFFRRCTFGLITLWDVVEHLSKPRQVLENLYNSLESKGLLVLTTPDVESLPARMARQRWIGFKSPCEHLWYFSSQTMTKFLKSIGFKVEKILYVGKYVKLSMFIERLSNYLPELTNFFSLLHKKTFSFYINPLDIICVIARKP